MGVLLIIGSASIFQGVFKIALPVASAMNLLRCAIYLAWFVYIVFPLIKLFHMQCCGLFDSFVSCDRHLTRSQSSHQSVLALIRWRKF